MKSNSNNNLFSFTGLTGAGEEGQAIVELTISLVAVMVVFLGVIFAFALGDANVEGIIDSRGQCDLYAGNGQYNGDSGRHVLDWDPGADHRIMTNDDTATLGGDDNPDNCFTGELTTPLNLADGIPSLDSDDSEPKQNFAKWLSDKSSIFLIMADLTKGSQVTDPYEEGLLEDLQGAFRSLIYDSDMNIENSAYMPVFYEE